MRIATLIFIGAFVSGQLLAAAAFANTEGGIKPIKQENDAERVVDDWGY